MTASTYQLQMRAVGLIDQSDGIRNLWELVNDYRRQILVIPEHQRDFVWLDQGDQKVKDWVERISMADRRPVGAIVTYQINDGNPSPVYINDGSQRVRATEAFLLEPERFGGCDKQTAEAIIRTVSMPVQHRHYPTNEAALQDFQWLNLGTGLTPYDFSKGILTYMPNYEAHWKPIFDQLHEIVATATARLSGRKEDTRATRHKFARHDLALFFRFLSRSQMLDNFVGITSPSIRRSDLQDRRRVIEWAVRSECEQQGVAATRKELDRFSSLCERETATLEKIWFEQRASSGLLFSPTLHRWLLDCAIWRTNNNISVADWVQFVTALLQATQGVALLSNPRNDLQRITISLGKLGILKPVCDVLQVPLYAGKPGRSKNKVRAMPGWDSSHIQPFVTHGDGPTILEPASINRARGARPIEG